MEGKSKITNFSQAEKKVRQEILGFLKRVLNANYDEELIEIEIPPQSQYGEFAVPCFKIAKKVSEKAHIISQSLANEFNTTVALKGGNNLIQKARSVGPYLNFLINWSEFSKLVLKQILSEREKYGCAKIGHRKKIMVEYFSPNVNKPLSVGHLRNLCLGWSISKIFKELGYKVVESTLYNDRGIAICKSIIGYEKWGQGKGPRDVGKKSDHFVGEFYVKYYQEAQKDFKLEEKAKEHLQLWEQGDQNIRDLWSRIVAWVLAGFDETLKKLGDIKFDVSYFESDIYPKGRDIILKGYQKRIFKKHHEGYIYASLEKYRLPDKILLRPDSTSLYIVQDIYLAKLKDKYKLDKSIYVVGSEQDLAFRQLFKILELLGEKSEKHHLSYGMMRLPEGKIKSREGLVKGTDADGLIDKLDELARIEVEKREPTISKDELDKRAHQIALAALKFYILQVNPKNTMIFNPKESLSFTGKTGPYLQYVYARIVSILKKSKSYPKFSDSDFSLLKSAEEKDLIKHLSLFPKVIEESAQNYDPSCLAHYLYDLAKSFSNYYEKIPILNAAAEVREVRLLLILAIKAVVAKGLNLLGIKVLERM